MTNELHQLLDHIGYSARPQQEKLFDLLSNVDKDGVIAQAGTGTGKSIAVLAAAAKAYHDTGIQSLVVTPTRVLMDQYMAKDVPAAAECFNLDIVELRGKRWYDCALSVDFIEGEGKGCLGKDSGCSLPKWELANGLREANRWFDDDGPQCEEVPDPYVCGYQEAKYRARAAQVVVTNSDFWIINDRVLPDKIFDPAGAVFVDESHQLEAKLKDYAGKSLQAKELEKYYPSNGVAAAKLLARYRDGKSARVDAEVYSAMKSCFQEGVWTDPVKDRPTDRSIEVHDGLGDILLRLDTPSENCIIWSDGWSIKMDWIDISASARGLLTARPFGLVSATIPTSMPAALGVPTAKVADVGHPFDYAKQARLVISTIDGSFKYAGSQANLEGRVDELREQIELSKGGCLLLFSSFADMKRVYEKLSPWLYGQGCTVLMQNDELHPDRTNQELGEMFKADGRAILFGSESFATGFDVPGDALTLVSVWKLPYPGKDPITDAMAKKFFARYRDLMLTRVVQGAGRLIRTESDQGTLFIADARAEDVIRSKDLMVRHLGEFARN